MRFNCCWFHHPFKHPLINKHFQKKSSNLQSFQPFQPCHVRFVFALVIFSTFEEFRTKSARCVLGGSSRLVEIIVVASLLLGMSFRCFCLCFPLLSKPGFQGWRISPTPNPCYHQPTLPRTPSPGPIRSIPNGRPPRGRVFHRPDSRPSRQARLSGLAGGFRGEEK